MPNVPTSKNVILFLSNHVRNNMYWNWITKYLQPNRVNWNFAAETASEFTEITKNSPGKWDVLLADVTDVLQNQELLERFIQDNPGLTVGVIYQQTPPPSSPLTNAVMFESPSDIDEWLLMMYQLLG